MPDDEKKFDLEAAKSAGHSDADIAGFLATQAEFDLEAARTSGHSDANIIHFLTTGKSFKDVGQAGALKEGFKRGFGGLISDIVGAPRTASDAFINLLPEGALGKPGSITEQITRGITGMSVSKEQVQSGLEDVGIGSTLRAEDLPPEQRPAFIGGEMGGGSIIPMGVPVGLAKAGIVGRGIFKPILNMARTAPKRFLAAEAAGVTGAALGGAGAEFMDPGDPLTRFLAEAGGGLFNPSAIALKTSTKSIAAVKTLTGALTKTGRESKAAEVIQDIISEAGEDKEDIIRLLEKADIEGVRLTSGQKTGSPALLAIEAKLAAKSDRFAGEAEELASNSLKQLRELTDNLTKSGDPQALSTAAKLRQTYFDDLLTRRLEDAGQDALEARAAISPNTRADIADVSTEAKDILSRALKDARRAETSLWGRIPKDVPLAPDATIAAFDALKAERLLPGEDLPGIAEKTVAGFKDKQTLQFVDKLTGLKRDNRVSTAGEILQFRKRLLAKARDATAKGDFDIASQFNLLAEGTLDDLGKLSGGEADAARAFSRALHEKFTNTFAGDALAKSGRGGQRIAPETLLERAFGGGGTKAELRLRQMGEAANFPHHIFGQPMLDEQEKFLAIAAKNTVDSAGTVNPDRLRDFIAKNQATLDRFPDLKGKLANAVTAEDTFRGVELASKRATKAIQQRTAFANLLKTDDPIVAVGNVLTGPNTRRNFTQLAKLAKGSSQASVDGLRSSTIKNAFDRATNTSGQFSFSRLDQIMKKGLSKEDQGILPLMLQTGVIDRTGAKRLKDLMTRGIEIEDALGNKKKLDKLIENPDLLFDLVVRIVGANIGTKLSALNPSGRTAGSSLIAASAGSRFARNFAEKIPATKVSEILELAANDQKFMATLLKKAKTIKQSRELERQMNAFLISAGFQFEE